MKKFDFSKGFGNIDPKYISEAEGEWKEKKNVWIASFWSKLAAACVILALISTVLSNPKVQAAIKNLALSIGETLGFQKEIEPYTEALNISQTDHGITANIKEVVLDEGVLLFRVHAEIDNTEENEKKKTANISSFRNTGITLDMGKTTINGQKLDEYMNAEYSPYSVDDLLDADADSDEKEYDRVQERSTTFMHRQISEKIRRYILYSMRLIMMTGKNQWQNLHLILTFRVRKY